MRALNFQANGTFQGARCLSGELLPGSPRGWLSEPSGCYSIGKIIAVTSSLSVLVARAPDSPDFAAALTAVLLGSPRVSYLTAAIIVLVISGEIYHRAWVGRGTPDPGLTRIADLVSGCAALILTLALVKLGILLLALFAGTLLAVGKIGCGLLQTRYRRSERGRTIEVVLRISVTISRPLSLAILALQAGRSLSPGHGDDLLLAMVTFVCVLLWFRGDVLLARSAISGLPDGTAAR